MKIIITLIASMFLFTQCGRVGEPVSNSSGLVREIDREAGIVCYGWTIRNGIYCLPLEETALEN